MDSRGRVIEKMLQIIAVPPQTAVRLHDEVIAPLLADKDVQIAALQARVELGMALADAWERYAPWLDSHSEGAVISACAGAIRSALSETAVRP